MKHSKYSVVGSLVLVSTLAFVTPAMSIGEGEVSAAIENATSLQHRQMASNADLAAIQAAQTAAKYYELASRPDLASDRSRNEELASIYERAAAAYREIATKHRATAAAKE